MSVFVGKIEEETGLRIWVYFEDNNIVFLSFLIFLVYNCLFSAFYLLFVSSLHLSLVLVTSSLLIHLKRLFRR